MSAFADDPITGERSPISSLFEEVGPDGHHHYPNRSGSDQRSSSNSNSTDNMLRARTITLLHPDTPLNDFIFKGFSTLRRVCDHITVVGDRKDFALDTSEIGNGIVDTCRALTEGIFPTYWRKHSSTSNVSQLNSSIAQVNHNNRIQNTVENENLNDTITSEDYRFIGTSDSVHGDPDLCWNGRFRDCCTVRRHGEDILFGRKLTVGRNIFSLYVPIQVSSNSPQNTLSSNVSITNNNVSQPLNTSSSVPKAGNTTIGSSTVQSQSKRKLWIDLDAIDTTWMESNVHAMRHNYFNINPVLIEDLNELLVTGKRAKERSLLLHREGNIYSYCNAPPFIVNE